MLGLRARGGEIAPSPCRRAAGARHRPGVRASGRESERTRMKHASRRIQSARQTPGYERHKRYPLPEAVALLGKFPKAKFDETVELSVRLGVDPKKNDQTVRGSVSLPKGIGKSRSVVVFAEGDAAREAQEAGADAVGTDDLAKRIAEGWTGFDVCIAHPA